MVKLISKEGCQVSIAVLLILMLPIENIPAVFFKAEHI